MNQVIDRLTTVWDSDFTDLDRALNQIPKRVDATADKIEQRLNRTGDKLSRDMNRGVVQAFDKVGTGAEKAGSRASTALARIGGGTGLATAGLLTGAAAATAFALALGQINDAFDYADGLEKSAKALGTNTTRLQEMQGAAILSGIAVEDFKGDLNALNEVLGAMKSGQASGEVKKAFANLGLTQADLKPVEDVAELLPLVAERIKLVGNAAEQAKIAKALGLDEALPLLVKGADAIADLATEARRYGLVLDEDLIRKGAEANRQLDLTAQIIQGELRGAFIQAAPAVTALAVEVAKLVGWLAEAIAKANQFSLVSKIEGGPDGPAGVGYGMGASLRRRLFGQGGLDFSKTESPNREFAAGPGSVSPSEFTKLRAGALASLANGGKGRGGRGARDASEADAKARAARLERAEEMIYRATLAELDIHNGARRSIEDRLALSLDRLDLEDKHRKAELDQLEKDYRISAGKEGISQVERERLEVLEAAVASGKRLNLKEEAALDLAERRARYEADLADLTLDLLGISDSMAKTQAERRKIQLEILDSERTIARKALAESLRRDPNLTDAEREGQLSAFDAVTEGRTSQVLRNTQDPLESFFDGLPRTTAEVNEAFQQMEAEGLSSLIDGLAAASVGAADLGDVFRNVLQQMAMDANRILLQSLISGAAGGMGGGIGGLGGGAGGFGGFLKGLFGGAGGGAAAAGGAGTVDGLAAILGGGFGFAKGTDSAPGGLALVGEQGPEIVNLKRGAQVIPNDILRSLARAPGKPAASSLSQTLHVSVAGGPMDSVGARRTGAQIGAEAMRVMARAKRRVG